MKKYLRKMHKIRPYILDARRSGFGFMAGGIKSAVGKTPMVSVSIPGQRKMHVRPGTSDFEVLRQVFRDQQYRLSWRISPCLTKTYEAILKKGKVPVIVDAGANIGAACLWFAEEFPEASIVAVEPDPDNLAMLRSNVADNPSVTVIEAAIGSRPGHVSMTGSGWSVQTKRSEGGCPVVTIGEAFGQIPGGELFIVKIDIEGFESDLFAENTDWIDRTAIVYIEPHDWKYPGKGTSKSFQAAFGKRDFEIHLSGENIVYVRPETACAD